jgi:hypothetical protein
MPLTDRVPDREVSTRDPLIGTFSNRAKPARGNATPGRHIPRRRKHSSRRGVGFNPIQPGPIHATSAQHP